MVVKRMLQLWGIYGKLDLLWFLRDTKYCLACIFNDVITSISAVLGVFLLAERFGNIGGMTSKQILFMLGYATIVDGVMQLFFSMNVAFISRIIGRGQLDHRLIQPVPLWMQLATEGFLPISGNSVLLCGIGITAYATRELVLATGPQWIGLFLLNLGCSIAIILSYTFLASCLAFYAPVAGEEISTTVNGLFSSLHTFPIGGFNLVAKTLLCTAVPVGLAAWFPANVLLGQTPQQLPDALLVGMTIVLVITTTTLFRKGMRHYAKRGSNRYSDRGHRR